jgi:hypothetical protein
MREPERLEVRQRSEWRYSRRHSEEFDKVSSAWSSLFAEVTSLVILSVTFSFSFPSTKHTATVMSTQQQ